MSTSNLNFVNILYFFFLLWFAYSQLKPRFVRYRRHRLLNKIGKKRNSKVITLIHTRSQSNILDLLMGRYIGLDDSQQILNALRDTPKDKPIDIILHTPGGLVIAAEQIAQAILDHPAKVTVFVPQIAMSGGTLIALACDQIVMDKNAFLGRLDPQISGMPAYSILQVLNDKPPEKIKDDTIMMADVSKKAIKQIEGIILEIVRSKKMNDVQIKGLLTNLISGKYNHDNPITFSEAKKMELKVSDEMSEDIYKILDIYTNGRREDSPVDYIEEMTISFR